MYRRLRSPIPIAMGLAILLTAACRMWALSPVHGVSQAGDNSESDEDANALLIATADFNRDGIADVAEIVWPKGQGKGLPVLQILFGGKNGSHRSVADLALADNDPRAIVAGDFNRDGNADLLIGNGDGSVTEFLGDGTGNLRPGGEVAHVGSAVSIAVGDFNRDGIPDIAVSDFRANAVAIFLGAGGGAFAPGWSFALPKRGNRYYLASGDFNYDGVPDLAITSDEEGMFVVMLGNGNGTFTYAPEMSHIRDPHSYCPT